MLVSKFSVGGGYVISGHTKEGDLVQYTIEKNGSGWAVNKIRGNSPDFNKLYNTKAEAVQEIKNLA